MKKRTIMCFGLISFASLLLILSWQNPAVSQQIKPSIPGVPENSIVLEVNLTNDMISKDYYYRIYYAANGNWAIPIIFYEKRFRERILTYSQSEVRQISYNKFQIIDRWGRLKPGEYMIAFVSSDTRLPSQEIIQTLKISSNTKKALQDKYTLIVDDSTGVAPEKGTDGFQIRYELNEVSNMLHKILRCKDDHPIWEEKKDNVPKGTRGFEWEEKVQRDWYKAFIKATSISDKDKWDKELSRKFLKLE